ncbi:MULTISPECIES: hypothetical protein [Stenotrophomonas]|jgi:hypothetical protein|uniref:hypothetical protein n=1 Tax=Stenotrophomonas TaxID=40323 RepID=UPI0002E30D1B|nr:hypothetical protein [Stenotrophomonas sp. BIO128-Bstrain]WIA60847.1 hypothetical protein POS15_16035 [Stenotrophomonas sp. BIO128-Bstrain]
MPVHPPLDMGAAHLDDSSNRGQIQRKVTREDRFVMRNPVAQLPHLFEVAVQLRAHKVPGYVRIRAWKDAPQGLGP